MVIGGSSYSLSGLTKPSLPSLPLPPGVRARVLPELQPYNCLLKRAVLTKKTFILPM